MKSQLPPSFFRLRVGTALAAAALAAAMFGAPLRAQSAIVLREYWSFANADNATSSDPAFLVANPGYRLVRDTGRIIPPNATQPLDTLPLHTWWSRAP